ncbi:MAG: isoprenyl transferase [bacterium]|nr:isoprenyl transferase [bacterium]
MNKQTPPTKERNETGKAYSQLLAEIDLSRLPRHVAIIMDGNGRWANVRRFPRIQGHREGVRSVDDVVACARELGIPVLTLYAFSVENWNRPQVEIRALMALLKEYIKAKIAVMQENNIRFNTIGRIDDLPGEIQKLVRDTMEATKGNGGLVLNLALSYGGRAEIVDAVRAIVKESAAKGTGPEVVDEALISAHMYSPGLPDPDMIIRTSGEHRISNFLTWQSVYSEFYFTPLLWPDFKRKEFLEAIIDFQKRERRFGLTGEQVRPHQE